MKRDSLKQLLIAWRDHSLAAVDDLLGSLFVRLNDVLLEYAEKAESNELQAVFLDGRRELDANEEKLRSLFSGALSHEIFLFMQRPDRTPEIATETMTLVSKDAQELTLALDTICKQAIAREQQLYFALSQRLGVVSGSAAISPEALPAGPYQLSRILERVTGHLKVEQQVLLAMFALFEREVVQHSPAWHEELNERLRAFGILPNIKYTFRNRGGTAHRGQKDPKTPRQATGAAPQHRSQQATSSGDSATRSHEGMREATDGVQARGQALNTPGSPVTAPSATGPTGRESTSDRALPVYLGPDAADDAGPTADMGLSSETPQAKSADARGHGSPGDELLGRIRGLLTARRARTAAASGQRLRPDPKAPASPSELADIIGSLQVRAAVSSPESLVLQAGVRKVKIPRLLLQKMRDVLQAQRDYIKQRIGEKRLSYLDEDTIDVVGMLFDAMLKDAHLSNTIKALLSHLHTPYLKLAVRDRDFLSDGRHPARLLLENMIEAGSRWVDEGDLTFGVFPALQHVVTATLELKDYSPELFYEFGECLSAESRLFLERQEIREARTIETEKGKARLEDARREAGLAARASLPGSACPTDYQGFVTGPWTDYLTLLYLRCNGDAQNPVWLGALGLGQRLQKMVEDLGRGVLPNDAALAAVRSEMRERLGDVIPNYGAEAKRLFAIFSADQEIEIKAPAPPEQETRPPAGTAASPEHDRLHQHLRELPPGSWLVFHKANEPDRVAKLSWLNKKTERFLFVDQTGNKAIVVSLSELADQIGAKRAHVLPASGESYVESTLAEVLKGLESG